MIVLQGRTYYNNAGTKIATADSNPVNVNTAGIIIDSLDSNHALMNQESQTTDSTGQPHIIISYVPGQPSNLDSFSVDICLTETLGVGSRPL